MPSELRGALIAHKIPTGISFHSATSGVSCSYCGELVEAKQTDSVKDHFGLKNNKVNAGHLTKLRELVADAKRNMSQKDLHGLDASGDGAAGQRAVKVLEEKVRVKEMRHGLDRLLVDCATQAGISPSQISYLGAWFAKVLRPEYVGWYTGNRDFNWMFAERGCGRSQFCSRQCRVKRMLVLEMRNVLLLLWMLGLMLEL